MSSTNKKVSPTIQERLRAATEWVDLGPARVGRGFPTYFIAEIGNNHNGDFFLAKRMIEEAAKAGAHAVKLQKRSIRDVFAKELIDKPQTKEEVFGRTYGEYREGMELSFHEFLRLRDIANSHNVAFIATPFDIPSVDFLEKVGVPFYKIASFDVTNLPLVEYIAKLGKPIVLSTGMTSMEEIDEAVETILKYHNKLIILHCVSVYPSADENIHMSTLLSLQNRYRPLPVGYSGHEQDILPTLVALARGASLVERHITLSKSMPGPDHSTVSIEPPMFTEMVQSAARIRNLFGTPRAEVLEQEKMTRTKHSKSIVSAVAIPKGTVITGEMLTCKSPGYGLKPKDIERIIGKRTTIDIPADVVIRAEHIEWSALSIDEVAPAKTAESVRPHGSS